jgi:Leucine-rich repeat (LRR) protein
MTRIMPIQGLRVSRSFADVSNAVETLRNLDLDINDLDRIRGISQGDIPVSREDIQTISGLKTDLEKQVIAIWNETRSYQNILSTLNDGRKQIAGNIDLSGSLVAPSFKFKTIDFAANNNVITVDLSTSRSSAWSSFGDPSESVFYGGDVILSGANTTIELSNIEFTETPRKRKYAAQIPTHKIRIKIDGDDYDVFAMKGIPLRFRGFFSAVRTSDFTVTVSPISNIRPTWVIRNPDGNEFAYIDRLVGTTSSISFTDTRSQERAVEFYYPVSNITSITLNNANIFELAPAKIDSLISLSVINGDLIEMPDIGNLYGSLQNLNLSNNDLTRSNDQDLRTLSDDVIARLPTSLRALRLDNTYSNAPSTPADLSVLTNLISFIMDSSSSNARRMVGTSPKIGTALETYNIRGNNFTAVNSTILDSTSTNLKVLNIRGNNISGTLTLTGTGLQNLEQFLSGENSHGILNLSGKQKLQIYACDAQTFPGDRTGTSIFNNCSDLREIRIQNTNITGALPSFATNPSLEQFYSWNTQWNDADGSYSIGENTFGNDTTAPGCRTTLKIFNLQSGNLRNEINPDAFRRMTSLISLVIRSYRRGITGLIPPSINDCSNLLVLNLDSNQMSGAIPIFSGNQKLNVLILSTNNFTSISGTLSLPNLRTLFLQTNQISGNVSLSCPLLIQLNISFNNLAQVPDFTTTTRIQELLLNNNSGMKYSPGGLLPLTSARRIEIANCNMNQGEVDSIITDLNQTQNVNPRGNVIINLQGNAAPSIAITPVINRLRNEGWTIAVAT